MSEFKYEPKENCVFIFPTKNKNPKAPLGSNPIIIDGVIKDLAIWIEYRPDDSIKYIMAKVNEPYERPQTKDQETVYESIKDEVSF